VSLAQEWGLKRVLNGTRKPRVRGTNLE